MTSFPQDTLTLVREVPASTRPLLTIVVCAYRHAPFVGECLAAIDGVAAPDMELVIIDDGSPDDTLLVCGEYVFDPQLPVRLFTKRNAGLVDSLRLGLQLARGEYVAFIASDDAYTAEGLASVLTSLRAGTWHDDATLCQAIQFGDIDGVPVYGKDMHDLFSQSPEQRYRTLCLQFPRPMLLQATIFRTVFLRELAPWNGNLELDDWPTFIQVFAAAAEGGARVRFTPELCLTRYRIHSGGVHNQLARQLRATEQVARQLVPASLRRRCLANVRIDIGLIHLYERRIGTGLALCARGLLSCPTPDVLARVVRRGTSFVMKRWARRSATVGCT